VVYIQRLLFGPLKLSLIRKATKKLVYDFDDAVMYGTKGESLARKNKFKIMIRYADAVFCGNHFLLEEAQKSRQDNIYYVPTVVDTDEYQIKLHKEKVPVTVGWIGSSSTLRYLSDMREMFLSLSTHQDINFKIVADKPFEIQNPNIIFEKWEQDREKASLLSFDIGIMPLKDDVWSKGKCGLKLIQYMASGIPSIAHPVGAAKEIIEDGGNGFLRADQDGWKNTIKELSKNVSLREKIGRAARKTIEERYALRVWGPRVAEIIGAL